MVRLEYMVWGVAKEVCEWTDSYLTYDHLTPACTIPIFMAGEPIRKECVNAICNGNNALFKLGLLRGGEVVVPSDSVYDPNIHLTIKEVSVHSRSSLSCMAVNIKVSKIDSFRGGVTIYLGRIYNHICPVATTLRYMVERGLLEGPWIVFEDGRLLIPERFIEAVCNH